MAPKSQYQVLAGKGDLAREARSFGRNGFLFNLNENGLASFEDLRHLTVLLDFRKDFDLAQRADVVWRTLNRLYVCLKAAYTRSEVQVVEKCVLGVSHFNECRVETGNDLLYAAQKDVSNGEQLVGLFVV